MNAGGVKNKRRRETRKVYADRNRYKHSILKVPNVEFDASVTVDSANAALGFDINAVTVLQCQKPNIEFSFASCNKDSYSISTLGYDLTFDLSVH